MTLFWIALAGVAMIAFTIVARREGEKYHAKKTAFAQEHGWEYRPVGLTKRGAERWIVKMLCLKHGEGKINHLETLSKGRYMHGEFWMSAGEGTDVRFVARELEANFPWTFIGDERAMPFTPSDHVVKFTTFKSRFVSDPSKSPKKLAEWFSASDDPEFLARLLRSGVPGYMNEHGPKALLFFGNSILVFGRLTNYEEIDHATQFLEYLIAATPPRVWEPYLTTG